MTDVLYLYIITLRDEKIPHPPKKSMHNYSFHVSSYA